MGASVIFVSKKAYGKTTELADKHPRVSLAVKYLKHESDRVL